MPSSKNYKRNYKQEAATEPKVRKQYRLERNKARNELIKEGKVARGDGKEVDHKVPLSKGGSAARSNLRVRSASANHSYKRTSSGAMKNKNQK